MLVKLHVLFAIVLCLGSISRVRAADGNAMKSVVFLNTGEIVRSDITGADDDSLTVVGVMARRVAWSDVTRIVVRRTRPRERGFVSGTLLGIAGLHIVLAKAGQQPAFFVRSGLYTESRDELFDLNALPLSLIYLGGTGIGGGLGALLDGKQDYSEETIVPGPTAESQRAARQKLREWITTAPRRTAFRIVATAASVDGPMQHALAENARKAGLSEPMPWWFEPDISDIPDVSGHVESAANFTMLRRVQATYSITPSIETGISVAWLAEPVFSAIGTDYGSQKSTTKGVRQIVDTYGYYIVGLYNAGPFIHSRIDMRLGMGAGVADIDYQLGAALRTTVSGDELTTRRQYTRIAATVFSALLIAECSWRVYDHLSLGFTADYAFIPVQRTIPAVDFLGLPNQKLSVSNAGIGFILGLHL